MPKNVENVSTGKFWFALIGAFPYGPLPIGKPDVFSVHNACSNVGNDIGKILLDKATQ